MNNNTSAAVDIDPDAPSGSDFVDFNTPVIDEFRRRGGVAGGYFEGIPLVLLTSIGNKTKRERTTPLAYIQDKGRVVVAATFAGSDRNPSWYYNVTKQPRVVIEVGTERFQGVATEVLDDTERRRLFDAIVGVNPRMAGYGKLTDRKIPVFVIERSGSS